MPLPDFPEADTFVAYTDISGFKELMRRKSGWQALNVFYSSGYRALQETPMVEGLFVSDCGVLFVRDNTTSVITRLESLLKVIKEINKDMRDNDFMLTTSIAYGPFAYKNKIEFPGIEKNPLYGNAYVSAVYDNEDARPKLDPLQCRIVADNFPLNLEQLHTNPSPLLKLIRRRQNDLQHYYFYWMVNVEEDIESFERIYQDSYNLKYSGMLNAAKKFGYNNR
jgi:hypothetical protein